MKSLVIMVFFFVLFASPSMPMQDRMPFQPAVEQTLTQDSNKSFYNEYSFKTYISHETEKLGSNDKQVTELSERAISRKRWVY